LIEELRRTLRADDPERNLSAVLHAVRDFAAWRGNDPALDVPPSRSEIETYLADGVSRIGDCYQKANVANLQIAAVVLWGADHAGMIGTVLRDARCAPKAPAKSNLDVARSMVDRLPLHLQAGLVERLPDHPRVRPETWSASHVESVARALAQWLVWCERHDCAVRPTGVAFHAYAHDLVQDGISSRSARDYLCRILSGYRAAMDADFSSAACDLVIADLRARGKREGRRTKTGDQIVGASTLFDLGLHIIDGARLQGPRGLAVARDYRNGLLLVMAAAMPQRARALSHFAIGTTVTLLDRPFVRIRLPGRVLKLPEHRKAHSEYDKVIQNAILWDRIDEYQGTYRPLFDDRSAMFPSVLDKGASISPHQLGHLVGNLTERHLGVRVSVQRVRDNVATESSEELRDGGYLAPALLGHRSAATTMAYYDHAQGNGATRDFGEFVRTLRSRTSSLRL
jgi:hypothetical protein